MIRKDILDIVCKAGEGHIPSAFSIAEIMEYIYDNIRLKGKDKDYFILSKAHGCAALYAILKNKGFITQKDLDNKSKPGSILGGHPDRLLVPGVDASLGSLGHGLAIGLGIALGLKIQGKDNKVIVLLGDGECNEGTVWEAALLASHLRLGNLIAIVDNNKSSYEVLPMYSMKDKWQSFGWFAYRIDGHDKARIAKAYRRCAIDSGVPKVIVADTIKGKGVSFMENNGKWHYKVPNKQERKKIDAILSTIRKRKV